MNPGGRRVFSAVGRWMHRTGHPAHHWLLFRTRLWMARREYRRGIAWRRSEFGQAAAAELTRCLLALTGLPGVYRTLDHRRRRNRPHEPDALTQEAVRVFFSYLDFSSLPPLSRAILYGSRARGDHRDDSDVDIMLVFADAGPDDDTEAEVCNAMADAQAMANAALAPKTAVMSYCRWADDPGEPDVRFNPWFYRNVLADGIDVTFPNATRAGSGR